MKIVRAKHRQFACPSLAWCACIAASVTVFAPIAAPAHAQSFTFRYETGPAYVAQNDNRYGANGTELSAREVGLKDNLVRVQRASLELGARNHSLTLTYIPFDVATRFTPTRDIQFRDTTFASQQPLHFRYLFDGYRVSYLYHIVFGDLDIGLGGSAQVRNAQVALASEAGGFYDNQNDIGLVGALKTRIRWAPQEAPWVELDADALSTFGLVGDTTGAIYDVALSVGHHVSGPLDLYLTTRLYGGGAEVPDQQIDNWANFVSATAGARVALDRLW